MPPALVVDHLSVAYGHGRQARLALREVSLKVAPGETYGIVGESGSGKTTLALAVMRYLGNGRVTQGSIELAGRDVLALSPRELRAVWRSVVKLVPQNPLASLNPSQRIGRQLEESVAAARQPQARTRVLELLSRVGLADPARIAARYPHQLSGGQQQRVMIAMALASEPALLVMDEPTTNLDVTTEKAILELVRELVRERDTAVLYVSHSLGVIAQLCDKVAVLYAGELVEEGPTEALFARPLHPYTRGLLDSVPTLGQDRSRTPLRPIAGSLPAAHERAKGCVFAPRCPLATDLARDLRPPLTHVEETRQVRCHRWQEIASGEADPAQPQPSLPATHPTRETRQETVLELKGLAKRYALGRSLGERLMGRPAKALRALDALELRLKRQRTVGLVGESGSGKSTLARCIVGLSEADSGEVRLFGAALPRTLQARDAATLRRMQMVFQNADEALNPYRSIGSILRRPLMRLGKLTRQEADARVVELLRAVKLEASYAQRLPAELSGGEKQRVAIARAFATEPELVLFDESVSGLDVSVQAAILNLLGELQRDYASAFLFISHDLAVISYLADEIAVLYLGQLMEIGEARAVLHPPYHPYTEALLAAAPSLTPQQNKPHVLLEGEVPSPIDLPSGCPFHTRCPRVLGDICRTQAPPWQHDARGKRLYCHIPLDELAGAQARGVD